MVHRMLLAKVGERYVHLLKMFGAFFTFGCMFNVFSAAYNLSVAVDTASIAATGSDVLGVVSGPIANLFIWLSLMIIGLALYRSDRTIVPWETLDVCQICGANRAEICSNCVGRETNEKNLQKQKNK